MPKRRYRTKDDILKDIDKWKRKSQMLMESAAALDLKADECFKVEGMRSVAEFSREEAKKKRRSAFRIDKRKLRLLKEKLAEYLTDPLPGTGVDKDIQAS